MGNKVKKMDIILMAIIIIVAMIIFIFYKFNLKPGNTVVVYYDNNIVYKESLDKNVEKTIETPLGLNKLTISNGKVKMIEANCPDQLCVYQKAINKVGENIVCLPHKLIVKIINNNITEENELDSISN